MNRRRFARILITLGAAVAVGDSSRLARADVDPLVARGVEYLRKAVSEAGSNEIGETALAALALIKADTPPADSTLAGFIRKLQRRFSSTTYSPEKGSGGEIYEATCVILALANHDAAAHRGEIDAAAQFLLGKQNANGSWDYRERSAGDTSISQYAVLGLWEAENAGVKVPPKTWDKAASWFLSVQGQQGSWTYHRDGGGSETISMTAAGVGSLLICYRQLQPYRIVERAPNPLLIPLTSEAERARFRAEVSQARIVGGIRAGMAWLSTNFTTGNNAVVGQTPYYALYGIERVGALADQATLGRNDWYNEGKRFLTATQRPDGSFSAQFGDVPNTAWAVLFVTKSTAKTIRKIQIRRLGSGTLVGGRGLPRDLSQVSIAGGKVVARPMDGAVEDMLGALEDPRVDDASAALAGLIGKYATDGPRALRPHEERFRKLLTDPDQGVRRVACWALARTGDLAMTPLLIERLRDPDENVVREAREGLQLLSRLIEGLGPPDKAPPGERERAIDRWQAWYESVRPIAGPTAETRPEPAAVPAPAGRRTP